MSPELQVDYLMRYFELHANQRMTTFNFYVVLAVLLVAAAANVMPANANSVLGTAICFTLMAVSYAFYRVDRRIVFMIKLAESQLIEIESDLKAADGLKYAPFSVEAAETTAFRSRKRRKKVGFFSDQMSYSQAFNFLFMLFGVLGFTGLLLQLLIFYL